MTKSLHNPKCRGIIHFISSILLNELQVTNGSDIVIIKDKEPIIRVPEN